MGNLHGKSASGSTSPTDDKSIRIVMVAKTGAGKSATGNTILGEKCFKSQFSLEAVTTHCKKADGVVDGQKVAVIDTPGLFDTSEEKTIQDISQCISYASPGPHIFLIVIKLNKFTEEDKQTMQKIQEIFGEEAFKFSMVLFTHGDKLNGKSIEELLKESEDLQELVDKCHGQYHVFNNEEEDCSQVRKLLKKIRNINVQNGGSYYTTEMFQNAARAIEEEKQRILRETEEQIRKELEKDQKQQSEVCPFFPTSRSIPPTVFNNDDLIRIVMVGKTGAGKSATGNTILGQKCFKSKFSISSLTTFCKKADGVVDGQLVAVIDTPGLFDTRNTEKETVKDITQCIAYASPGPHIFLVVIRLGRFTAEEKQTVQKIQKIFGEEANKYSMVLFTHGDLLKGEPIKEFLEDSTDMQELVDKCNDQYHVFNNEEEDCSQVSELLKKIRNINEQNGGSYYTTEMFQKAEKAIEEEKEQILKENEEQNRKEEEELRKKIEEKYQQLQKEYSPISRNYSASNNDDLIRIVMVGKTGVGKSATGNTILGQKCFNSEFDLESLTTVCDKAFGEVDGQKIAVIDTPGLFDTRNPEEKTIQDISQSIAYASPGPHIFLIIIRLGIFTEEEKKTVQKIQEIFGEEANKYSMVLFTHGDQLKGKSIEEFLKESEDLLELVAKCSGQYHVFNNEVKDRSQVSKLLKKIKQINEQNGGSYYTTEMFQKAERVIEEEKQRILKEKEEQNSKELEELRKKMKEKLDQQMKEVKADKERENKFRDAREKEMMEEIEKLKKVQKNQARREAEERPSLIQRLRKSAEEVVKNIQVHFAFPRKV